MGMVYSTDKYYTLFPLFCQYIYFSAYFEQYSAVRQIRIDYPIIRDYFTVLLTSLIKTDIIIE